MERRGLRVGINALAFCLAAAAALSLSLWAQWIGGEAYRHQMALPIATTELLVLLTRSSDLGPQVSINMVAVWALVLMLPYFVATRALAPERRATAGGLALPLAIHTAVLVLVGTVAALLLALPLMR